MLEAREEVLIPLIDDEGISYILHGGKLIGGGLEAATKVIDAELCRALGLVGEA